MRLHPTPLSIGLLAAALLQAATLRAQEPAAPAVKGFVRLHIESPLPVQLTEHLGAGDTKFGANTITTYENLRTLCVSPCDAVIDARVGHGLTLASPVEAFPDPPALRLDDRVGDVTVFVTPGSNARKTAGLWLTVLGATGVLLGGVAIPLDYYTGAARTDPAFNAGTFVMLLGGAAALGGGIPLLLTGRTTLRFEPRARGLALTLSM